MQSGALCNIEYASDTNFKLKSLEIWFVHAIHISCPIILTFCTEHGSITAVLCENFQNDQAIAKSIISHPGIPGVTLCFCTGSYAAAVLFTR